MTREEAASVLADYDINYEGHTAEEVVDAFDVAIKALKAEPCNDTISRQAVIYGLAGIAKAKARSDAQKSLMGRSMFFVEHMPPVQPISRWIPIKTRPMTEEEKEDLRETEWYDELYELEEVLDCPMPDDGQEVWITVYGRVERDVYHNDFHGCYFDDWEISDVTAWMTGPEPYKGEDMREDNNESDG